MSGALYDRLKTDPRHIHKCIVSAYFRIVAPRGSGPHLNYKNDKWWTFNFIMFVSVAGISVENLFLIVSFIIIFRSSDTVHLHTNCKLLSCHNSFYAILNIPR